jgi:hypothetical protein
LEAIEGLELSRQLANQVLFQLRYTPMVFRNHCEQFKMTEVSNPDFRWIWRRSSGYDLEPNVPFDGWGDTGRTLFRYIRRIAVDWD